MKGILPLLAVFAACVPREKTLNTSAADNLSNIIETTESDSSALDRIQVGADTSRNNGLPGNANWTPLAYDSGRYIDQVYTIHEN